LNASQAVLLGEAAAALLVAGALALVVWGQRRAPGEAAEPLGLGLLVTVLLLAFPITWNWGVVALLLPLGTTALALQHLPRPPHWWFVLLGLSLVLLVNPEWLPFLLAGWRPLWSSLFFSISTISVLLFAAAQAYLLVWAARLHLTQPCPEVSPASG
jgi:hypothetical protein